MATNVTVSTGEGSTQVTVITGEGATSYSVSAGSRGPAGATGAAGPNTITTATTTPLVGFLSGNGSTVTASTSATFVSGSVATFNSGSEAIFNSGSNAKFKDGTIKLSGTSFDSSLNFVDPTSAKTITLPDATGTVALTDDPRFTDARTPLAHTHVVGDIVSIASQHLIGRHAGATGAGQEVNVGDGIEFQGSGIRRSALTGDITASAGSNATTLAATIAGDKTFSGALSLTSTTRPTSSGTGTPAATSLITTADGDARYSRITFGILATNFDGAQNSNTLQNVTGLIFSLEAGTYQIEAFINHNGNASFATAGTKTRLHFTGSSTGAIGHLFRSSDAATVSSGATFGPVSSNPFVTSELGNRSQNFFIRGQFVATTSGTFSAQIAQSVATVLTNTTAGAGSYVRLIRTD